ncbi:MAG: hypothetical protein QF441_00325 [Bacteriovoracaceae bacterium]|jgi:hypothetical protein|nr:hypothetical protein [Halobacteriovoraceae bacterium]MDP7319015.1 hypothetical protein [Bacteriovoracaceae bacterium]|tara:strand:- start:166 stop:879 length:714 start_codon:yes stop_codon:yes gene_type:complete
MKVLAFFIIWGTLLGCAQRIKVPINRMLSPEAIGKGAKVEYREIGYSSGVLDFSNNSTENALIMGTAKDQEFNLDLGIAPNADIFIKVPEESSSVVGIKVQVLGNSLKAMEAGHKLAFTLGMGSERDSFDQTFKIDLKSDVNEFSLIHGYRLSPLLLIYDGISLSNYYFEGKIENSGSLDKDNFEYTAKNIIGAHVGVILGGSGLQLKLEVASQKIAWSNTEEKLFQHFGMALNAGW